MSAKIRIRASLSCLSLKHVAYTDITYLYFLSALLLVSYDPIQNFLFILLNCTQNLPLGFLKTAMVFVIEKMKTNVPFIYPKTAQHRYLFSERLVIYPMSVSVVYGPLEEGFCVKRVTGDDVGAFVEKVKSARLCDWGDSEPGDSDFVVQEVLKGNHLIYACTSGDRLIGYFLLVLTNGEMHLDLLCSRFPSSEELRLGVGSTLLRVAESVARNRGYTELRVPRVVPKALHFYLDRGYRVVRGSSPRAFFADLSKTL